MYICILFLRCIGIGPRGSRYTFLHGGMAGLWCILYV